MTAPKVASALPPPTLRHVLLLWQWHPAVTGILLVLSGGYLVLCWRVARRHRSNPWPATRTVSFLAGLAVIAVATQSAAAAYDGVLFSAHMVQHVLDIMVAPPLLVYGRPVTLLLHAAGNPVHGRLIGALRSPVVRAVTWPPATTALYILVVAGTHTPPVMDLVLRSELAHAGEHALYLVVGYLYFLPVVGSEPAGWRLSFAGRYAVLLLGMQADSVVGLALTIQTHGIFAGYAASGRTWPPLLVADQRAGGVVMWAGSDLIMAALAIALAVAFVHGRRRAGRMGGRIERGRRASLHRRLAAAQLDLPVTGSAATIDDDAHLAAYNAFLASLPVMTLAGDRPLAGDRRPPVR